MTIPLSTLYKKVYSIVTLLCILHSAICQTINLGFEHIKPEDGLTNRHNDFIKKDSRGYVWISSMEGAYRFDGLKIEEYLPDPNPDSTDSLKVTNNIQSGFFEDSQGNIWFTPLRGLSCYLRRQDTIISTQIQLENGQRLTNGYSLFYLQNDSTLWLKAAAAIYRYNTKTKTASKIIQTKGFRFAVETYDNGALKTIYACPWISYPGIEVIRFEGDQLVVKERYLDIGLTATISKAIPENDTLVWLCSNKGLLAFNPEIPNQVKSYEPHQGINDEIKDGALLGDKHLLVITKNSGLWVFDRKERAFIQSYEDEEDNPWSIASNSFREIYLDDAEHLWLANTYNGAIDYSWIYRNRFYNPFGSLVQTQPIINSIIEDANKQIWCATEQQGVFVFDLNGKEVKRYDYNARLAPIKQLSLDEEGNVWALSDQEVYQLKENQWVKRYTATNQKLFGLIHFVGNNKIISSNLGIFEVRLGNNQMASANFLDTIPGRSFYPVKSVDNSRIYFPVGSMNLMVYNYGKNSTDVETIAVGGDIYSIWEVPSTEDLILGTSIGIKKVSLKEKTVSNLLPDSMGFHNTQVYSVKGDEKGRYWFTTNAGLWYYDPQEIKLNQYRTEDGLPSQAFTLYGELKASDGRLWFGTNEGLVQFHPDSIRPYTIAPIIQFRSLKINQQFYETDTHIEELDYLSLKHHQNTLTFELIGISHFLSKFNQLKYRLKAYEEEWNTAENGASIQYIKIPPGNYSLQVYGINANGEPGSIKNFEIKIAKPFWQTAGFWVFSVLFAGLVTYQIYSQNLKRKLRKQKEVFDREQALNKALQSERNRIAGEMHDDIGGDLTSIGIFIKNIAGLNLSVSDVENIEKIEQYANRSLENMREIIWAMNSNYDTLLDSIIYIRQYVMEFLDNHQIKCSAALPEDWPNLPLSGKKRRNLFLCAKESVHNIVKHAEATEVVLKFELGKALLIRIQDNGKGIDFDQIRSNANGLRNMNERMQDIEGNFEIKSQTGTTIVLSLSIPKYIKNDEKNKSPYGK